MERKDSQQKNDKEILVNSQTILCQNSLLWKITKPKNSVRLKDDWGISTDNKRNQLQ